MTIHTLRAKWQDLRARLPRWVRVAGWAGRDFVIDDGLHWAAAIAFYGVLSIFPLLLAGVHIAAWFVGPHGASQQAWRLLHPFTPHADAIRRIVDQAVADRHGSGLFSLLVLLYTGGRVFAILIRALNVACNLDEIYGFFRRLLVEMGMLLSVGLLFFGALVANLLTPILAAALAPFPHAKALALAMLGRTLPALLLLGGFFCLYKFVPRHRCNWQSALWGAGVATMLCMGAKPVFVFYVGRLASYSEIYGWLTIGIVLMLWAQILSIITLYGGELASHVQMIVYDGLSGEEVSRRHRIRSPGRSPDAESGRPPA